MNKIDVDRIKADAWAYVMGMPFVASSYLAYDEFELKVWEDGLKEAVEFRDMPVSDDLGDWPDTDGCQGMDLCIPLLNIDDLMDYGLAVDWNNLELI